MDATADSDTMTTLVEDFSGWHIWRGRGGHQLSGWYATRRKRLTNAEFRARLFRTLAACANSSNNRPRSRTSVDRPREHPTTMQEGKP